MTRTLLLLGAALLLPLGVARGAAEPPASGKPSPPADSHPPDLHASEAKTDGTVTIGGVPIAYQAVAGTLIVHPKDWDDAQAGTGQDKFPPDLPDEEAHGGEPKAAASPGAEASMFYVAYLRHGAAPGSRPITFLYNGGPGSSTVWLHMGAFGPRRVVTADDSHGPAAPYPLVDNAQSLLDASDLVFIDAPGTGFGRIAGHDAHKAFWGIDQDAYAFSEFITAFLTKYGRWNSPKFLFGESYGTTRSAVLVNLLEQDKSVDVNGVILLSQVLNFDASPDDPQNNPGVDLAYVLALPTYAATAWYHHKLPGQPADLPSLLAEVKQFATHDYLLALQQGAALDPATREAIVGKLHQYTGLSPDYLRRADLRIGGGEFEHELQSDDDTTTGRLDTRFSGPSMDPLDKEAQYDPQSAAIGSAYVSAFNDYVRRTLHYADTRSYKPEIEIRDWDDKHKPPGADEPLDTPNVMPDLAAALKYNPTLKVQLNAGFFDLATPFFQGIYEMQHLPMPRRLQANIEYHQYQSGHMVYANQAALQQLHDNVADFIRRTDALRK